MLARDVANRGGSQPQMRFVGLIPARGGSKSISKKNLANLSGKPLLAYTCEAALKCSRLHSVILSTDDEETTEVGKTLGVEVPFLRPSHLSDDKSPMIDVLQHALNYLENKNLIPTALVLLQPTSPLRTSQHIQEAIKLFIKTNADSVVSIVEVPHQYNPISIVTMQNDGIVIPYIQNAEPILRRQDKPKVFARNGPSILIVKPSFIKEGLLYGNKTVGYVMDLKSSIDIDSMQDLEMASFFIKHFSSHNEEQK